MTRRVFVYGTLKRGYGNNRLLQNKDCKFVEERILPGFKAFFSFRDQGFPVAKASEGDSLKGEVWEIPDGDSEVLRRLDGLEGEGYMYSRTKADDVELYVGHPKAWTFDEMKECPSADGVFEWNRGY